MSDGGVVGVVLAGGEGRRMGGGDKGLLMLGGEVLVAVAVRRLRGQVGGVIVNANRNYAEYQQLGFPVVGDDIAKNGRSDGRCAFAGPLAGMLAGLRAAGAMDVGDGVGVGGEWVVFVPCDCPFFPVHLSSALIDGAKKDGVDIAVAVAGGREQPVFLLVRCKLADDLESFINDGGRKIDLWYRRHRYAKVLFDDVDAFVNINTPEDLMAAEKRLTKTGGLL